MPLFIYIYIYILFHFNPDFRSLVLYSIQLYHMHYECNIGQIVFLAVLAR